MANVYKYPLIDGREWVNSLYDLIYSLCKK